MQLRTPGKDLGMNQTLMSIAIKKWQVLPGQSRSSGDFERGGGEPAGEVPACQGLEPWDGAGVQRALLAHLSSRETPHGKVLGGDDQESSSQPRKSLLGVAHPWASLGILCTTTDVILYKARTHTLNSVWNNIFLFYLVFLTGSPITECLNSCPRRFLKSFPQPPPKFSIPEVPEWTLKHFPEDWRWGDCLPVGLAIILRWQCPVGGVKDYFLKCKVY